MDGMNIIKAFQSLLVILWKSIKYVLILLLVPRLVIALMRNTKFIEWVLIPIGITQSMHFLLIILVSPILVIVLVQKSKRIKRIFAVIVLVFFFVTGVVMPIINPLYGSERKIRAYVLEITPMGTSMNEVLDVIAKQERWERWALNYRTGYSRLSPKQGRITVGEKHISARLGVVWLGSHSVVAYWGFDFDGKLIDVSASIVPHL